MVYQLKELEDSLPEVLQNKPRWVHFLVVATSVFIVTLTTIAVGALLGYSYCYFEYRTTMKNSSNVTQSANLQIIHMPYPETAETKYNRTINGAINGAVMSSVMMSRIMNLGQAIMDNDLNCIPMSGVDRSSDIS